MSESVLRIVIDSSKAKKGADDVTKSLKDVEIQGDKTEKSVKGTAKVISDTGNTSKTSAKKVDDLSKSISVAGTEAKTTSGKIGELKNSLAQAANNGKFGSHMQSVTNKLSEFRGGALLVGAAVTGALVGGVAIATGYLAGLAIEVAKNNVELARFSAIANTSITNFQGLAGAAATFGVSQEKTADMLKDFNEKLGEFNAIGAGGAVDFFEQIAVKTENGAEGAKKLAEEMSKMDGIDALQTYVNKLEEVGVNQKEMSFYLDTMGSDLTALAPLLADGGKLWKDYQQAMEDAGILTSQEAIEKSIELTAQTESLQMRFGALKSELASQIMPVLSTLLTYFMDGSSKGRGFTSVIEGIGFAAKGVGIAIVGLSTGIKNLVELMSLVVNQFKTIGTTAVNFANAEGIMAKGSALLAGTKDFVWGNGAKAVQNIYSNTKNGISSISDIASSQAGQYDALTQSMINNQKAMLERNKTQGKGRGGGAEQNKNLFPTAKAPKSNKAETNKALNEAKRLADQQKREAERLQAEIERAKDSVIKEYASKEERLLIDYNESKKEIEKGFAKDPVNQELYLKKAKDAYDRDVVEFKKAEQQKRDAAFNSVNNPIGSIIGAGVFATANATLSPAQLGRFNLNTQHQDGYSQLGDDLSSGVGAIDSDELMSEQVKYDARLSIYQKYVDAKKALDDQYTKEERVLEDQTQAASLAGYSAMFGMMGSMLDAYGDKEGASYKAAFALQRGFVLASAFMNAKGAIMSAWNDPANVTIWQKMAGAAAVAVQTNGLMSAIQGVALSGFETGGYTGSGGRKDVAGVVHGQEYVLNAQATKRVGVGALDAINSGKSLGGSGGGNVTINQSINIASDGTTTTQNDSKQLGALISNTVLAVIRREQRQGGLLSK